MAMKLWKSHSLCAGVFKNSEDVFFLLIAACMVVCVRQKIIDLFHSSLVDMELQVNTSALYQGSVLFSEVVS